MIPEEKKEFLKAAGLSDEELSKIEGTVKEKAEAAEGLEFKEADDEPKPEVIDPADIVKAVQVMLQPLAEKLSSLEIQVKELSKSDIAKVKEAIADTPKSSLEALAAESVKSLFGSETQVDGRKQLAKSGPKETVKQAEPGLFFQSWMQPAVQEEVNV